MSKWKRITGGKNAISLYHFTHPGTYWHIASEGLTPGARDQNEFMTGGLPVVWLMTEESNVCAQADIDHMNEVCEGGADREVGDLNYGERLRLTVRLNTTDRALLRYSEFLERFFPPKSLAGFRKQLSGKALDNWWVYAGVIPPKKIEPISVADYAECLKHHIETHPDIECREMCRRDLERLAALPSEDLVEMRIMEGP